MHALRDCVLASRMWLHFIPSSIVPKFFEVEGSSQIFDNLASTTTSVQGHSWPTTFMVTAWFLWQWYNKSIFEEGFRRPHNYVETITNYVADITNTSLLHHHNYRIDTALVRWNCPANGWFMLNIDGASKGDATDAGCGGLLRDATGRWIKGFARRIETCTTLLADMWRMWIGVEMAYQSGYC